MGEARDVAEGWFKDALTDPARWIHEDILFESPAAPPMRDREVVLGFVGGYKEGFPDGSFQIDNVWESGDTAIVEGKYIGTNTGPMKTPDGQEMPPTGKPISLPFISVIEAKDGKMINHRAYWDQANFAAQLGMGPQ
jgi:ketosteroid isomerase-like protein